MGSGPGKWVGAPVWAQRPGALGAQVLPLPSVFSAIPQTHLTGMNLAREGPGGSTSALRDCALHWSLSPACHPPFLGHVPAARCGLGLLGVL